ncbi:hypothetical protein IFM89_029687 [Coptis chinensis]|uniref:ATP synthase delta chain, chloroplastic n=1 Tax=Coptis chinensis TaxID=261450 RepID=A0A835M1Q8_9MAGN|nr:hypothetical protein IFM89_029687 [Coptis chinensis]
MDTLSTSVSSLNIHSSTPREFNLFKPPNPNHVLPPHSHLYNNKSNTFFNRPTSFFPNKAPVFTSPFNYTTPISSLKAALPIVNRKASSGYAAALLDIARCDNTLDIVDKDVRRLSRLLHNADIRAIMVNPLINANVKRRVVKELVERGKFQRHLVVVLKMLVGKNKVEMVTEVLEDFQRIYDELNGTRVVLVSSAKNMEEDKLFGIAKKVQRMSGAMKVKAHEDEGNRENVFPARPLNWLRN